MDNVGFETNGGHRPLVPDGFESEDAWIEYLVSLASQLPLAEGEQLTFREAHCDDVDENVTPTFDPHPAMPPTLSDWSSFSPPKPPPPVATDIEVPDITITSPTTAATSPEATRQTFYLTPDYVNRGGPTFGMPSFEYRPEINSAGCVKSSGPSFPPVFGASSYSTSFSVSNPNQVPVTAPAAVTSFKGSLLSPPRPLPKTPNHHRVQRRPSPPSSSVTIIPRHHNNPLSWARHGAQSAATVGISKRARSASPDVFPGVQRGAPRFGGQPAAASFTSPSHRDTLRMFRDSGPVLSISSLAHRRARSVPPTPSRGVSFLDMGF